MNAIEQKDREFFPAYSGCCGKVQPAKILNSGGRVKDRIRADPAIKDREGLTDNVIVRIFGRAYPVRGRLR